MLMLVTNGTDVDACHNPFYRNAYRKDNDYIAFRDSIKLCDYHGIKFNVNGEFISHFTPFNI